MNATQRERFLYLSVISLGVRLLSFLQILRCLQMESTEFKK